MVLVSVVKVVLVVMIKVVEVMGFFRIFPYPCKFPSLSEKAPMTAAFALNVGLLNAISIIRVQ